MGDVQGRDLLADLHEWEMTTGEQSTQTGLAASAGALGRKEPQKWQCSACTLVNKAVYRACEACGASRAAAPAPAPALAPTELSIPRPKPAPAPAEPRARVHGDGCGLEEERAARTLMAAVCTALGGRGLYTDPSFPPADSSLGGGAELRVKYSGVCGGPRSVQVLWRRVSLVADEEGRHGPGVKLDAVLALRSAYCSSSTHGVGVDRQAPPPYRRPSASDCAFLAEQASIPFFNKAMEAWGVLVQRHNAQIAVYNEALRAGRRPPPFVSPIPPGQSAPTRGRAGDAGVSTTVTGSGEVWCLVRDRFRAEDVVQGGLGTCWFVSAMAVVAERENLVERLFVEYDTTRGSGGGVGGRGGLYVPLHPAGVYQIRLCLAGCWRVITVDDHIPVNGVSGTPAYTQCKRRQAWALLLENAAAKACGSYACMSGGSIHEGLAMLTGAPTLQLHVRTGETDAELTERRSAQQERGKGSHPPSPLPLYPPWEYTWGDTPGAASLDILWLRMESYAAAVFLLEASIGDQASGHDSTGLALAYPVPGSASSARAAFNAALDRLGLVTLHAYSVLQVYHDSQGTGLRMVQLRNPWAGRARGNGTASEQHRPGSQTGQWGGDWCDSSQLWAQPHNARLRDFCGPYSQATSGVHWMAFTDFCRYFSDVSVAKVRGVGPVTRELVPGAAWETIRAVVPLPRCMAESGHIAPALRLSVLPRTNFLRGDGATSVEVCSTLLPAGWAGWAERTPAGHGVADGLVGILTRKSVAALWETVDEALAKAESMKATLSGALSQTSVDKRDVVVIDADDDDEVVDITSAGSAGQRGAHKGSDQDRVDLCLMVCEELRAEPRRFGQSPAPVKAGTFGSPLQTVFNGIFGETQSSTSSSSAGGTSTGGRLPLSVFTSPTRGFGDSSDCMPPDPHAARMAWEATGLRILIGSERAVIGTLQQQQLAFMLDGSGHSSDVNGQGAREYEISPLSFAGWWSPPSSLSSPSSYVLLEIHSSRPLRASLVTHSDGWLSRLLIARTLAFGQDALCSGGDKPMQPRVWTHMDGCGCIAVAQNPSTSTPCTIELEMRASFSTPPVLASDPSSTSSSFSSAFSFASLPHSVKAESAAAAAGCVFTRYPPNAIMPAGTRTNAPGLHGEFVLGGMHAVSSSVDILPPQTTALLQASTVTGHPVPGFRCAGVAGAGWVEEGLGPRGGPLGHRRAGTPSVGVSVRTVIGPTPGRSDDRNPALSAHTRVHAGLRTLDCTLTGQVIHEY